MFMPLIYALLAICAENLLLLRPLIARLSTEMAAFVSFQLLCCWLVGFRHSVIYRRHRRLLSHFVVLSLTSHLFISASRRRRRPLTRLLLLLVAKVDSLSS